MGLKFSLVGTSIPANSTIDSAKIMMYVINQEGSDGKELLHEVYRITQAWNPATPWTTPSSMVRDPIAQATTTPVTINPTPVTTFMMKYIPSNISNKWISFSVTSAIQAFWANPSSNNGVLLQGHNGGNEYFVGFCSDNHTTAAQRPKLIVYSHGGTPAGINHAGMTMTSRTLSVKSIDAGVVLSGFTGNANDVSVRLFDMQGKSVAYTRADNIETIQLTTHGTIGSRVLLASVRVGNSGETMSYKMIMKQ